MKTIMAIGAHPDDIELGCGAVLSRHIAEGDNVIAVIMTAGEAGGGGDGLFCRLDETRRALAHLGINNVMCFNFGDTFLGGYIPNMIRNLEDVINHSLSDGTLERVYTMCDSDRHQDHRAIFEASIVACRAVSQILCYETPSAVTTFCPNFYINITPQELSLKNLALKEHHSQQRRDYMQPEYVSSVARFRGLQAGCELSEAFEIYKMVT